MLEFVLIDGAMVDGAHGLLSDTAAPPAWLIPLYPEASAARHAPLLIDLAVAGNTGAMGALQAVKQLRQPALHVSAGRTPLSFSELAAHLRQYTRILDADGNLFYLRLADCRVLPVLAEVLTPEQWRAVRALIPAWSITLRDGKQRALPVPDLAVRPAEGPLVLSPAQIDAMLDAAEPDRLMTRVVDKHGELQMPHLKQHQIMQEVIAIWRACGTRDRAVLDALAEAALLTHGRAPKVSEIRAKLTSTEPQEICQWLERFCRGAG